MVPQRQTPTDSESGGSSGGAARRRRTPWFDPRFAIGLILVVVSVLGVVGLVGAANASVVVLAARDALSPGQRIHASDLAPTSIRADRTAQLYLRASDVPAAGVIVTRPVSAGELVPHSAVGSDAGAHLTSVVVSVPTALPASVSPGSRVDLWSAVPASEQADDGSSGDGTADTGSGATGAAPPDGGAGSFAPPSVLVSSAIVVRLVDQKDLVASNGSAIELLLPKSDVASVLDAIANGAILSIVPVDLPLGG